MLSQATDENSEPTWATQTAMSNPKPLVAVTADRKRQIRPDGRHPARRPEIAEVGMDCRRVASDEDPIAIRAINDTVFADVKTFWMILPSLSPRVLMKVRRTITTMAVNCCADRLRA